MQKADTRFDLVAMLSAGAGAAEELDIALPQEYVGGNRGGMWALVGHWWGRLGWKENAIIVRGLPREKSTARRPVDGRGNWGIIFGRLNTEGRVSGGVPASRTQGAYAPRRPVLSEYEGQCLGEFNERHVFAHGGCGSRGA